MDKAFMSLLYIFGIFGFYVFASDIAGRIMFKKHTSGKMKLILAVNNREDSIEGSIRELYKSCIMERIMSENQLAVIDMNSDDRTVEMLKILKRKYPLMNIYNSGEIDKAVNI